MGHFGIEHMSDDRFRQAIELLETWLRIDSTSGNEAAFLAALEAYFSELGFKCERLAVAEERWNLLVTRSEAPRFLYSTHVDTVPPFFGPRREGVGFPGDESVENGAIQGGSEEESEEKDASSAREARVYARGACDTKGGIVAMAHAGVRLLEAGIEDFGYLFVVGEEVDHCGAKRARDTERLRELEPERIVLCEPTRNRIVSAQKGMVRCRLTSSGVAGHSAFPARGDSAINPLLDALGRLRGHAWPQDELLGPTTLNIGTIQGGVAANVFAADASAELLFRCVSDTSKVIETIHELVDAPVEVSRVVHNDPVFFDVPDAADGFEICTVPFNTDATYLGELAPIWLVGPGDIEDAHSDHEYISLKSLAAGIDLYEKLALRVLG